MMTERTSTEKTTGMKVGNAEEEEAASWARLY
jgi:hypothetical protein